MFYNTYSLLISFSYFVYLRYYGATGVKAKRRSKGNEKEGLNREGLSVGTWSNATHTRPSVLSCLPLIGLRMHGGQRLWRFGFDRCSFIAPKKRTASPRKPPVFGQSGRAMSA